MSHRCVHRFQDDFSRIRFSMACLRDDRNDLRAGEVSDHRGTDRVIRIIHVIRVIRVNGIIRVAEVSLRVEQSG